MTCIIEVFTCIYLYFSYHERRRDFLKKLFDGTAGKGPLQQRKMLSSQFCFPDRLWFDVFKDYSLQTCYGSVVYLKS